MKQKYTKPTLATESFELTQSIATGCGAVAGGNTTGGPAHWAKSTCGWKVGFQIIWVEGNGSNCNTFRDPDVEYVGVCYNNPGGNNVIYTS